MRRGLAKTVLVSVAAVIAVLFFVVAMTVAIGIYQIAYPEKIISAERPETHGLLHDDVNVYTSDGLRIAGWYIPRNGTPSDSVVIVLHGYPTEKGDLLDRTRFLLADHDLFLIDFRFFGASEGDYTTLGLNEIEDLRAAVRYVKEERGKAKVGVYGFSMGAAVALRGMTEIDGIDAVVAEASYADLRPMVREPYRPFGPFAGFLADLTAWSTKTFLHFDLDEASPRIAVAGTQKPVLLIHSRDDEVIPFENAEILQEALAGDPNAEFLFSDGFQHGVASYEYAVKTKEFFLRWLGSAPQEAPAPAEDVQETQLPDVPEPSPAPEETDSSSGGAIEGTVPAEQ